VTSTSPPGRPAVTGAVRAPGSVRVLAVLLVVTGLVTAAVDVGTVVALRAGSATGSGW